jgi:PAS domain S-box-containing protein
MGIQIGPVEINEEEKFRIVADSTFDWEEWQGPDGEIIYISPSCERITGYPPQTFVMNSNFLASIIHPFDLPIYHQHKAETHHSITETGQLDFRIIKNDGKECWINHYCVPIFHPDGAYLGRRVSNREITYRKKTEAELFEAQAELQKSRSELEKRVEERTQELEVINHSLLSEIAHRKRTEAALEQERDFSQSLIQTAQVGLLVLDNHGKILQMNPFLEQISGYTLEEVKHKDWFENFLLPEDQEITKLVFQKSISDIQTHGNITPMRTKNGQIRQMEWYDKTLKDKDGNLLGLLSIGQDVTKRKEIEEKVLKSAAKAEAMANITSRINADLDLNMVLSSICEELVHAIPAMGTTIIMLRNEEYPGETIFAAGYGLDLALKHMLTPVPISIYQDDLSRHGALLVIPDVLELREFPNGEVARKIQARTVINVIMVHHDEIVGAINLISHGEPYQPSDEELAFIKALASHATITIINARLFQQVSENRTRLQYLSQRLVKIQESERRNISRELHDEIGQELTSLILLIEVIKNSCQRTISSKHPAFQKLEMAQDLVNLLLKQIRELALDLRPGMLDDLGLLPSLCMHFERFTEQTGIQVIFKHSRVDMRFSGEIETTAFRIIQEALTNVARHAGVKQANVHLWIEEDSLMIQIQDDGAGFIREEIVNNTTSLGLLGMQERAALCGGYLDVEAEPGLGTCLTLEIPFGEMKRED